MLFSSSERKAAERRQQYKIVKEHMNREESDRFHAYGWSVPAIFGEHNENAVVPVPVFCRPLIDLDPSLKVLLTSGFVYLKDKQGVEYIFCNFMLSSLNERNVTSYALFLKFHYVIVMYNQIAFEDLVFIECNVARR